MSINSITTSYENLSRPGEIGGIRVRNRIVRSSMSTSLGNPDGTVSERAIRLYQGLAAGGAGLVMTEYAYVSASGKGAHGQLGISDDEHVAGLARLAGSIQAYGAAAGVQIVHTGRQSETSDSPLAPSEVQWEHGAPPRAMTLGDIDQVVRDFAVSAARGYMAGFDLVEIHAAHGYLLSEFLSPHTNRRHDDYGGEFENRRRIVERVIDEVLAAVPVGFPVTMRVSCTDYRDDGITLDETIELCRRASGRGIAAIHVSGGDHETGHMQWSPLQIAPRPHSMAAGRIRAAVDIPVITSGSISMPDVAEQVLIDGEGDFVGLARPLLADPEWPNKALSGRSDLIRPCIRCNDGCVERSVLLLRSTSCTVNPAVENDLALTVTATAHPRRWAVVGGGPAGMTAALTLKMRGHEVCLYEPHRLGGLLLEAAREDFKSDLLRYAGYLAAEIERAGIEVVPRVALPDELAGGYDGVVVASGARREIPDLPIETEFAPADPIGLTSRSVGAGPVVIVGSGYAAVEAALRLAPQCDVTVVVPGAEFLAACEQMERRAYLEHLDSANVEVRDGESLRSIAHEGVRTSNAWYPAELVAVERKFCGDDGLIQKLKAAGAADTHAVGDVASPGKVHDAVHSAFKLARLL